VLTSLSPGSLAGARPELPWLDEPVNPTGVIREFLGPTFSFAPSASAPQAASPATGTFQFVFEKGPNLLANRAASAALDQVAAFYDSVITTPITVVVDAEFAPLGDPSIIAAARCDNLAVPYDYLYGLMVAGTSPDAPIVSRIPTASQFRALMPDDPSNPFALVGASVARADLEALGVPDSVLPGYPSAYDPSVKADMFLVFNSDFAFDYNTGGGIAPDRTGFFSVALHEVAHGLGFESAVDTVDLDLVYPQLDRHIFITPLDVFRLQPGAGAADFTGSPRVMYTGGDQVTYDGGTFDPAGIPIPGLTAGDIPMSTGYYTGDHAQACHWKDSDLINEYIGIMDPTTAAGEFQKFTGADRMAFELLGYRVRPVPALGSLAGQIFNDLNGNGARGAGEVGLSDWTVYLDANGNGGLDPGEFATTTNAYGYYAFANLPAGVYHVREVVPPGWKETYPSPGFGWRVSLLAGINPRNLNFGDMPIPTTVRGVQVILKRGVLKGIVLTFDGELRPPAAQVKANYRLAAAGRDRRFGTRDDVRIRLRSAVYNPAARSVTLIPAGRVILNRTLQLRLNASGLVDAFGRPLDGDRDGRAGGDFVVLINKRSPRVALAIGAAGTGSPGTTAMMVRVSHPSGSGAGTASMREIGGGRGSSAGGRPPSPSIIGPDQVLGHAEAIPARLDQSRAGLAHARGVHCY
jgi:hypothetical protein